MELKLSNIDKSFGTNKILNNLSLTLYSGEIVGLVGRNGVGKTTLLKIIAGIASIDKGEIEISKKDHKIGFLSEKNPLYPDLYIPEYLNWISRLSNSKSRLDIDLVIKRVGLNDVLSKKIGQLSKGYKQRVGLAAAMISDPEILILDEPINGLDPIQIDEYRKVVRELGKDRIVILSSHLMQEVEAICDRVVLIKDGVINKSLYFNKDANKEWIISIKLDREINVDLLKAISGVDTVQNREECHYILSANSDVRINIFDCIVDSGHKLIEMSLLNNKLEKLF